MKKLFILAFLWVTVSTVWADLYPTYTPSNDRGAAGSYAAPAAAGSSLPQASFSSTSRQLRSSSTMTNMTSVQAINANGFAAAPKLMSDYMSDDDDDDDDDGNIWTPGGQQSSANQVPIGDVPVLFLLLLASAYAACILRRNRKKAFVK